MKRYRFLDARFVDWSDEIETFDKTGHEKQSIIDAIFKSTVHERDNRFFLYDEKRVFELLETKKEK